MIESCVIVNLDRKEFISPLHLGDGGKLWEFALRDHGPTNLALVLLLAERPTIPRGGLVGGRAGSWFGNRIAIVSEYEGPMVPGREEALYEIVTGMVSEYANISVFVAEMVRAYLASH